MATALTVRPVVSEVFSLPPETIERLRERFSWEEDEQFALRIAVDEGWLEGERRYLHWQRIRGRLEMRALMEALGIARIDAPDQAAGLFVMAYRVFMPPEVYHETVEREWDDRVRVVATGEAAEASRRMAWGGVVAGGTWHRRQGWYEAMGVVAEEGLPEGPDYIDPACIAEVTFRLHP